MLHRDALPQVLPDQAVRVLVAAAFPRVVRRREVARGVDDGLELLIRVELRPVVERERAHGAWLRVDVVLATQNPIEQEGTYHLPEAQLDRFMYELRIGYPSVAEEEAIVSTTTGVQAGVVKPVLTAEQLREMQQLVRRLPAPPSLVTYAVGIARATRPDEPGASAAVRKYVSFGAGPRAGQYLVLGAKARAAMDGRSVPDLEDVDAVAFSVLRHRVVLNFQAEAEGMGIERILELGQR